MVMISACLFHPVAFSFIASKWFDCHWEIGNGANYTCLFHSVALSCIGSKLSDCQ